MSACSVEGCERPSWARGWCGTHYRRWSTTGTVEFERPTIEQRFRSKLREMPSGCWEWTAGRDKDGYGKFAYGPHGDQTHVRAHRWAYELWVGPIPAGAMVCHTCDNPPCVSPGHLFIGSASDNKQDEIAKGRNVPPRGARNGQTVLTEETVRLIKSMYVPRRYSYRRIARQLGLNPGTVRNIIQGRNWAWV